VVVLIPAVALLQQLLPMQALLALLHQARVVALSLLVLLLLLLLHLLLLLLLVWRLHPGLLQQRGCPAQLPKCCREAPPQGSTSPR
jgi:hypothetical protein